MDCSCFFASFFLLFVAVSVFLITQESGVLKTASCGNAFKIAVISVSLLVVLSFLSLCAGFFFQRKFKRAPSMIKFFVPGWGWYRIFLSPSGISLAEVEDEEIKRLAGEKGVKRVPARKKVGIPKFLVFQFNKFFVSSDVELNAIVRASTNFPRRKLKKKSVVGCIKKGIRLICILLKLLCTWMLLIIIALLD